MSAMNDFPIDPPLVVKDDPKPRRLATLAQARAYVERHCCGSAARRRGASCGTASNR
jgi:hypothetical protein